MAENSRRWTPYNYAYNNPVYFVDPDGMQGIKNKGIDDVKKNLTFNNGYDDINISNFSGSATFSGFYGTEGDGWIKTVNNETTSYTHNPNINTVEQATAAGIENVTDVQQGYNISATDGSYSYDLNLDGSVTNASNGSNIQFHKPIISENGFVVGGAFQTAAGSKIYTNNVGEVGGNTFPRASGAITDDTLNFTANLFAIGEIYKGGKLIYMGLTTIPKSSVGIRTVFGASKNTLRSSVYFENRIGQKAINIFGVKSLPTLYGKAYTWGTFYGRNASLIGTGRVGIGGTILNN